MSYANPADPRAAARFKRYREAHPERVSASQARFNATPEGRARYQRHWRKKAYGLTEAQFKALMLVQCGKCAICQGPMEPPCVDHDHATGCVRGLLCGPCNGALGWLKDNAQILGAAIDYLAEAAA